MSQKIKKQNSIQLYQNKLKINSNKLKINAKRVGISISCECCTNYHLYNPKSLCNILVINL